MTWGAIAIIAAAVGCSLFAWIAVMNFAGGVNPPLHTDDHNLFKDFEPPL